MDQSRLDHIPAKPGIYLWKDQIGEILYVGKAKNLRNRMRQYFRGMLNSYKTAALVRQISDFDYIITPNERDALILEKNFIEKHLPKFNVKLLDDKHYPYIEVRRTQGLTIKTLYRIRSQKAAKNAFYYGPFPTGFGVRKIVNLLNRMYVYEKGLPIVNFDLATLDIKFREIKKLLSSQTRHLVKFLKEKMQIAAEKHNYEMAHEIKQTIQALETLENHQTARINNLKNIDVVVFLEQEGYLAVSMLFYRQGNLLSRYEKIVEKIAPTPDTIRQFVSQYYQSNLKPDMLLSNWNFESTDFQVIVPRQGNNKKIVDLAIENARDNLAEKLKQFKLVQSSKQKVLQDLQTILGLESLSQIDIVDTSHTNNTLPIGVVVVYQEGVKVPRKFRKYSLTAGARKADVEYMQQLLFKHYEERKNAWPSLLIVDGGRAQQNIAQKILPSVPVVALGKNREHKTDYLLNPIGQKIKLKKSDLYNFLSGMQIEVDRYAKVIHRRKRQTTLEGILTSIKGIGLATEKKLLEHFGDYASIYNASVDELTKVVPMRLARAIKERLGEK
ncbi:GIY-YIG nuclease family protein [Mycoplasma sp. ATU-Cv-508]|uniref:GIY-YIG nuclease family protein n=1 Tax=Mycoplasma sp. ATU-Cv-508 TaxID=2048001 RepID=UPI000FDEC210